MPLYEYRCQKCGRVKEVLQKFSDRPLRRCDVCSGKLEKLISRTSFQLKGGGWFSQGYGAPPAKAAKSSEKKTASADSSASKPKKSKAGSSKTGSSD